MERTECVRWVLIVGGAGAAACLAWTLLAEQDRRQRRRQSGNRKRLAVDKLAIQGAINRGVQKKKEATYQSMNGVWQGAMLKQTLERDEAYFAPRIDDSLHEPADNAQDQLASTYMCEAARRGDVVMLEQLVSRGVAVNQRDAFNRTPLHLAAMHGHVQVVQWLIERDAHVSSSFLAWVYEKDVTTPAVQSSTPWWSRLADRIRSVGFVNSLANRSLEIMLYPIDLLSGAKYIEAEERNIAIEKKKRAQAKGRPAGAAEAAQVSAHLQRAAVNVAGSIYYSKISDEAARFAKQKREWRDPDFPPEPASLFLPAMAMSLTNGFSAALCSESVNITWEQPRSFCSGPRTRGLAAPEGGSVRPGLAEPGAWLVADWGSWHGLDEGSGGEGGSVKGARSAKGVSRSGVQIDHYVGTCAVAALQDDPALCDDLLDLSHIAQGVCGVALYVDGRPSLVHIDTFFPCSPSSRLLVGAQARGQPQVRDAWPAAVEKAIAKTYGSYQAISGGNGICLALAALCGTSPEYQDLRLLRGAAAAPEAAAPIAAALWKRLAGWRGATLCGSRSVYGCEGVDLEGIVPGCTYHVLGELQVGEDKLLRLACALVGSGAWTGSHPLARSLQAKQAEKDAARRAASLECENAFWMPFARFVELFDIVAFAERRKVGWGDRERQELLALFRSKRAYLVPGVHRRQQCLSERVQADELAMQLIKQEDKEKKQSAKKKAKQGSKKKTASKT